MYQLLTLILKFSLMIASTLKASLFSMANVPGEGKISFILQIQSSHFETHKQASH